MTDAYAGTLERLFGLRRFGMVFGLERIERVLARLGEPHRAFRALHVAGTNGKGSTAAFAAALCRAAGLRTGLYTSPHLSRFTERIQVDGREVERDEVVRLFAKVGEAARAEADPLTFFEWVTAMAFCRFAEAGVDVAVVEVGLGGRLDATNVVLPEAAVVTGVALDHQEVLGGTIEEIAREKAGIFKPERAAVFAAADPARAVLRQIARQAGARPVLELGRDFTPFGGALGLAGPHQAANAALAIEAVRFVVRELPDGARDAALAAARWPGRLEKVGEGPETFVDCAHNPDGARVLARALADRAPVVLVVGAAADKDCRGILEALRPLAGALVATEPRTARALPAPELARLASEIGMPGVSCEPSIGEALVRARKEAAARGLPVVICGSMFLVGPVRELCLGERPDPIWVSDPNLRPGAGRA